jgi:hypothetical protein
LLERADGAVAAGLGDIRADDQSRCDGHRSQDEADERENG